ncbi:MAG TPA: replication initiator, partial [Streptosporangiaceae bacterium]|nr:replication initiator [Streptosporangiaceae bacterium]
MQRLRRHLALADTSRARPRNTPRPLKPRERAGRPSRREPRPGAPARIATTTNPERNTHASQRRIHVLRPRDALASRLNRWTHMLGYRGHFLTKSRRYSVTFTQLRQARISHRRTERHPDGQK